MLKELYIDNYKSLVNFKYEPTSLQLLVGDNGSGKTSVFDVLENLRDIVIDGLAVSQAFPTNTLTVWDQRPVQRFELALSDGGEDYAYELRIEHDRSAAKSQIGYEAVLMNGQLLYEFENAEVRLFRDDNSRNTEFPFDGVRSGIATIPDLPSTQRLNRFRQRMAGLVIFSPDPIRMTATSDAELASPGRQMHRLASWLRHLTQENSTTLSELQQILAKGVLPGLIQIKLERVSEGTRVLKLEFQTDSTPTNGKGALRYLLTFDQLSAGQRNLVALYAILCAGINAETTLCIDEPDNYVALREVQPWLIALRDQVEDSGGQCLLISHHPELLNYLAANHGVIFYRDEGGPTRVRRFESSSEQLLTPAELVARGWE